MDKFDLNYCIFGKTPIDGKAIVLDQKIINQPLLFLQCKKNAGRFHFLLSINEL